MQTNNKVQLYSDFRDYYDHAFDRDGIIFTRNMKAESRSEQFGILENAGFKVPKYGKLNSFSTGDMYKEFVLYEDEYSHAGNGKIMYILDTLLSNTNYDEKLVSEFICTGGVSISYRWLNIGFDGFFLQYISNDEWRSNNSVVDVSLLNAEYYFETLIFNAFEEWKTNDPFIDYPIFAIDFVRSFEEDKFYAIDFNSSPGISGTPIEDILSATDVYDLVSEKILTRGW